MGFRQSNESYSLRRFVVIVCELLFLFGHHEAVGHGNLAVIHNHIDGLLHLEVVVKHFGEVVVDIAATQGFLDVSLGALDLAFVGVDIADIVINHKGGDLRLEFFCLAFLESLDLGFVERDLLIDREPFFELPLKLIDLFLGWEMYHNFARI